MSCRRCCGGPGSRAAGGAGGRRPGPDVCSRRSVGCRLRLALLGCAGDIVRSQIHTDRGMKMGRSVAFLVATTVLAGCATHETPPPVLAPPTIVEPLVAPVPVPAPKPQYGTFGFDTAGMDQSVAPGDDFYLFANGTWAKNTQIPSDKSNYGSFSVLQDLSQQRVRDILDAQKDDPNSRIGMAYSSFLDEAGVEAKGLAPINPWLDRVRGLNSRGGYAALEGEAARNGITGLFSGFVTQDDRNTDVYITSLNQAGLGMPDRDMYLLNEPHMVSLKA